MTYTPKRIWACLSGPMVDLFVSGGEHDGWPEYINLTRILAVLDAHPNAAPNNATFGEAE